MSSPQIPHQSASSGRLPELLLASQSPRRKQLLEALGLPFTVVDPDAEEETPSAEEVDAVTLKNSLAKAKSVVSQLKAPTDVIIAADTLVVFGADVLGKPADSESVRSTLRRLSGQTHAVVTGLTLHSPRHGTHQRAVRTQVKFRHLGPDEVEAYAQTREPYDKAGSYAVQGLGSLFIESLSGSYSNVIGLPIEALLIGLAELTRLPIQAWFR